MLDVFVVNLAFSAGFLHGGEQLQCESNIDTVDLSRLLAADVEGNVDASIRRRAQYLLKGGAISDQSLRFSPLIIRCSLYKGIRQ